MFLRAVFFLALLAPAAFAQEAPKPSKQVPEVVCDHAPPPPGKHYECAPANSCDCKLVPNGPGQGDEDGAPARPLPEAVSCKRLKVEKFTAPAYPAIANQARIKGTVIVQIIFDAQGAVQQARALRGHPLLVPGTLDALRQWKFRPTGKAGRVEITAIFKLSKTVATKDHVVPQLPCRVTIIGHPRPVAVN